LDATGFVGAQNQTPSVARLIRANTKTLRLTQSAVFAVPSQESTVKTVLEGKTPDLMRL